MGQTIGAALITAALGGAGLVVARTYELRPRHLRAWQTALSLLATEISFAATPLPDALAYVGRHSGATVGGFVLTVADALRTDPRPSVAEAWAAAVGQWRGRWSLTVGDEKVLLDLAPALGRSFVDEQEKHLQLALARLARQLSDAETEAKVHVRLWRYAGFCAAGLLVLLLY